MKVYVCDFVPLFTFLIAHILPILFIPLLISSTLFLTDHHLKVTREIWTMGGNSVNVFVILNTRVVSLIETGNHFRHFFPVRGPKRWAPSLGQFLISSLNGDGYGT